VKAHVIEQNSKRIELALIFLGLVVLFWCLPFDITGDGYIRFRALRRLLNAERIVSMSYSMVGPLFALPLWLLGKLYQSAEWWIARFNFFVFVAGLFIFYRLLRNRFDASIARRFLLILMFGSMFPNHLRDFYAEVFTAMFVGVGVLAAQVGHPRWGWSGVVVGAANTPASMIGLGAMGLSETVRKKRFRFLLVPVAGALIVLAESWVRRGSPWISGYEGSAGAETVLTYSGQPGFSYPLVFGLLSLFFSFGKGLFFFAPGLLLSFTGSMSSLAEPIGRTYRLWLWFLAGLVVVYAKWWAWYGGWTWGPRYLFFASVPAAFALAVSLLGTRSFVRNLLVLGVLAGSFWVGMSGAVFGLGGLEDCRPADYEFLCWYVPEFSPLWRPFVVGLPLEGKAIVLLAYGLLVFVYLAAPVAGRLREGAGDGLAKAGAYLRSGRWGF
jgi:hypothetical protein